MYEKKKKISMIIYLFKIIIIIIKKKKVGEGKDWKVVDRYMIRNIESKHTG